MLTIFSKKVLLSSIGLLNHFCYPGTSNYEDIILLSMNNRKSKHGLTCKSLQRKRPYVSHCAKASRWKILRQNENVDEKERKKEVKGEREGGKKKVGRGEFIHFLLLNDN